MAEIVSLVNTYNVKAGVILSAIGSITLQTLAYTTLNIQRDYQTLLSVTINA